MVYSNLFISASLYPIYSPVSERCHAHYCLRWIINRKLCVSYLPPPPHPPSIKCRTNGKWRSWVSLTPPSPTMLTDLSIVNNMKYNNLLSMLLICLQIFCWDLPPVTIMYWHHFSWGRQLDTHETPEGERKSSDPYKHNKSPNTNYSLLRFHMSALTTSSIRYYSSFSNYHRY